MNMEEIVVTYLEFIKGVLTVNDDEVRVRSKVKYEKLTVDRFSLIARPFMEASNCVWNWYIPRFLLTCKNNSSIVNY